MKKLPVLKTLTSILFIFALIGCAFAIPLLLITIFMLEEVPFTMNGVVSSHMGVEDYLLLAAQIIALGFWTYALYLFKSVLGYFEKQQVFHDQTIKALDQTGKAILIGYSIHIVAKFLHYTLSSGKLNFGINFDTIFVLILGLFFMVLSEVFLIAKVLKEENDLIV